MKQLKLTSLFEKGKTHVDTVKKVSHHDPKLSGHGTRDLTPKPNNTDDTDDTFRDPTTTSIEHNSVNPFVESTPTRGDLTILDDLARQDQDWTIYTEYNRWGDTPPASELNSVIVLENQHFNDNQLKSVHFDPSKTTTDSLSVSFSQLEITDDNDGDQHMRDEPMTTASLAEVLEGTSSTTPQDAPTTTPTPSPIELPYLAELTWK